MLAHFNIMYIVHCFNIISILSILFPFPVLETPHIFERLSELSISLLIWMLLPFSSALLSSHLLGMHLPV